jgi:hypothetical protein
MVRRWTRSVLLVLSAAALASSPASADIILVDPNVYPVGTSVGSAFPDLTMTTMTSWGTNGDVSVVSNTYAGVAGTNSFGTYSSANEYAAWLQSRTRTGDWYWNVLELSFASPTNYIQMVGGWLSDVPMIYAFDAANNLLAVCTPGSSQPGCSSDMLLDNTGFNGSSLAAISLQRTEADIARIVFGGATGNASAQQISYNVPEPTTLGLALVGLGLAGLVRRRRR